MKNMKKCRLFKKCLAVTLSACMVLTMAVPAFATTKTYSGGGEETINYLVIGDSMSNGYCLDGFSFEDIGYDGAPSGIYSEIFSQYLQNQGYNVNLYQYAMSGMRGQDLRYILDPTFQRDSFGDNISEDMISKVRDKYVKAVEDADIISLALSMNDMGAFSFFRVKELVLGGSNAYEGIEISNIIGEKKTAEFEKYKEIMLSCLKSALGSDYDEIISEALDPLIDTMVYGLLSFMENFTEDMDLLREKNPDATIMVMGTMNSLDGRKLTFDVGEKEVSIDLGRLYDVYLGIADTYMQACIAASGDTNAYYVEIPSFGILVDELAELDKNTVDFSDSVEDGLLDSIIATFGSAINSAAGSPYTKSDDSIDTGKMKSDLVTYVTDYLNKKITVTNVNNARAIMLAQIYLGIRDAVIGVASTNSINGTDMMGALSDIDSVLANVEKDIMGDSKTSFELTFKVMWEEIKGNQLLRERVESALLKDGIKDALLVFDLCIANNGMGVHPSTEGHSTMGESLINAYKCVQKKNLIKETASETVSSLTERLLSSFGETLKKVSDSTSGDKESSSSDSELEGNLASLISKNIKEKDSSTESLGDTKSVFSELIEKYLSTATENARKLLGADLSEYTLSFDSNGGSLLSSITDYQDKSVDLSTFIPTKEGYTFGGWYSDSSLTNRVVTAILTETKTLYAKWIKVDEENDDILTENPFSDVSTGDYFCQPVLWAVNNGVTTGTSETTFSPADPCTRGQAVTFLWRAAGKPSASTASLKFTDVKSQDYCAEAVAWAVENGITEGTSATTFSPNDPCTRGQIVTFLYRAEGSPSVSGAIPFADVKASDYFVKPVIWAVSEGITSGTSSTTFSPGQTCTRGQIVTFLYRAA